MKWLRRIDRALARVEGWLIIIFLTLMVSLTFLQIVLRSLFTHAHFQWANAVMGQIDWTEPLVRLLVLWITFLGASLITADNKHLKIDLMSAVLPSGWLPFRELILSAACALIMLLMLKASIGYLKLEMAFGTRMFLQIPTWIGQLILPAGFLFLFFRFCLQGVEHAIKILKGGSA